jgi:hypothetical protein
LVNVSEPLDVGRTKWLVGVTNTFDPLQEIPPYLCALLEVTTPGTLKLKAHITTNQGTIGPRCPSPTAVSGFDVMSATPFNPMDCVNLSTSNPADNTASSSSSSSSESSGVPNSALGALAIIPIVIIAVAVYYLICVRRRKHAEGEPKVADAEAPAKVEEDKALPAHDLVMRSPAFGVHHTQPASTD